MLHYGLSYKGGVNKNNSREFFFTALHAMRFDFEVFLGVVFNTGNRLGWYLNTVGHLGFVL